MNKECFEKIIKKYNKEIFDIPLSDSILSFIIDYFEGDEDDEYYIEKFKHEIDKLNALETPIEDMEYVNEGSDGTVYEILEENKSIKIYKDNDHIEVLHSICSYVAFASILKYAYDTGLTDQDLSKYILKINFICKHDDSFAYVSSIHITEWSELNEHRINKSFNNIIYFLEEIYKLTDYGIFLTHGDLKLANILYTEEGQIKIIDFGRSSIYLNESLKISSLEGCPKEYIYSDLFHLFIFYDACINKIYDKECFKLLDSNRKKISDELKDDYDHYSLIDVYLHDKFLTDKFDFFDIKKVLIQRLKK